MRGEREGFCEGEVGPTSNQHQPIWMLGNLIENQFTTARDWPFGAAASFVLMAAVLVALYIYLRSRDPAVAEAAH